MTDTLPEFHDALPRRGFVYILTNRSMPGIVKIGRTNRSAELRAAELWKTGVPTPFEVWASVGSFDCVELERFVHGALRNHRVAKEREFFAVEPWTASEALEEFAIIQADLLMGDLNSGLAVSSYRTHVHRYDVDRLASEMGQDARLIADAMQMLTADELRPALERARSKCEGEDPDYLRMVDERVANGGAK